MHTRTLALALAGLLLAACDGASVAGPEARLAVNPCNDSQDCGPNIEPRPVAEFSYGSDVSFSTGFGFRQADMTSWSTAVANVASSSVSAEFRRYPGCVKNGGTYLTTKSASASGSPATAQVWHSFTFSLLSSEAFGVDGTHTFTPASGVLGGGTFSSSAWKCFIP